MKGDNDKGHKGHEGHEGHKGPEARPMKISAIVILNEAKNLLFGKSKEQILRPEPAPSVVEGASE
jgi:hypothetical protein